MRFDGHLVVPFTMGDGDEEQIPFGPFPDGFELERIELSLQEAAFAGVSQISFAMAFSESRNVPNAASFNALDQLVGPEIGGSLQQVVTFNPPDNTAFNFLSFQLSRRVYVPKSFLVCRLTVNDDNVRGFLNLVPGVMRGVSV